MSARRFPATCSASPTITSRRSMRRCRARKGRSSRSDDSRRRIRDRSGAADVAVIMDGNGRWARRAVCSAPPAIAADGSCPADRRAARRARASVSQHFRVFRENWSAGGGSGGADASSASLLRSEMRSLHKNGVRLRVIGERSRLARTHQSDRAWRVADQENTTLNFTVALSYGGRQDVVQGPQIGRRAVAGKITPDSIDQDAISKHLWTADLPIRPRYPHIGRAADQQFLSLAVGYCGAGISDTLWPDFIKADLEYAIREFADVYRRYGALSAIADRRNLVITGFCPGPFLVPLPFGSPMSGESPFRWRSRLWPRSVWVSG